MPFLAGLVGEYVRGPRFFKLRERPVFRTAGGATYFAEVGLTCDLESVPDMARGIHVLVAPHRIGALPGAVHDAGYQGLLTRVEDGAVGADAIPKDLLDSIFREMLLSDDPFHEAATELQADTMWAAVRSRFGDMAWEAWRAVDRAAEAADRVRAALNRQR